MNVADLGKELRALLIAQYRKVTKDPKAREIAIACLENRSDVEIVFTQCESLLSGCKDDIPVLQQIVKDSKTVYEFIDIIERLKERKKR